jgi:Domain of unknown function (DUF4432)
MPVTIDIHPSMFGDAERVLVTCGAFQVSTFRYSTGIAAIKLSNARGHLIVLPFKGQQIWRAFFDGRDLTMKSMFEEPVDTRVYLETYGAFFIHCGVTGMGAPGPGDTHPLHGELPNAPFQKAWIEIDEAKGELVMGGSYRHIVAFSTHYLATSTIIMKSDATLFDVRLVIDNLKQSSMDLMYLAHANFRPVDHGEIFYSAPKTPEAVRVRQAIPSHISPKPGYREFIAALAQDPTPHHHLTPGLGFDPEIVFTIDMNADADGFAHALLKRPDGTSDYIRYRPDQASKCVRWICRTGDQDAIGMAFPATAETEGYQAEKAKGNLVVVEGGQRFQVDMRMGTLDAAETNAVISKISALT